MFYLLKQLKILNQAAMYIVFPSLVLNKIIYAVQSYSGYLLEQQIDRLQAMLNKAKKLSLVSVLYNLCKILENQDYRKKRNKTILSGDFRLCFSAEMNVSFRFHFVFGRKLNLIFVGIFVYGRK